MSLRFSIRINLPEIKNYAGFLLDYYIIINSYTMIFMRKYFISIIVRLFRGAGYKYL